MSLRLKTDVMPRLGLGLLLTILTALPAAAQPAHMKRHETAYYTLFTDLGPDATREAGVRLTAMAEMYNQRTKGFAGQITRKLPFYLFSNPQDYRAFGGMPNTQGVYDGDKLMAWVAGDADPAFWSVVQHEGFHQFIDMVIRGNIPTWVNEGLAEYFGAAIFTGDGFVAGVVPPERLEWIKAVLKRKQGLGIKQMMELSHDAWNHQVLRGGVSGANNYVQAWSMVHFLAHANPRYQKAFVAFINEVSRGAGTHVAWEQRFGRGTEEFEEQWTLYWAAMSHQDILDPHIEAAVATLTSYYARAFSQKQVFQSADDFFAAARSGKLKAHSEDWLPPSLLKQALQVSDRVGPWQLRKATGRPELLLSLPGGKRLVGAFQIDARKGRVQRGSVDVKTEGK